MAKMQLRFIPFDLSLIAKIGLLMFYCSSSIYGQHHNDKLIIGDLNAKYNSTKDVSDKALILYDYCLYYQIKNYKIDSVLYYANMLLDFGRDKDYPPAEVLGHRALGNQYSRMNNFEKGKIHQYKSIDLAIKNGYLLHIHDSYNGLAKNYYEQSKLDSAIHYFHKSLETSPPNYYSKHSNFHAGLAQVYKELGHFEKQEEHLLLSYDSALKGNVKLDKMISLYMIVQFYSFTKKNPILFNKLRFKK